MAINDQMEMAFNGQAPQVDPVSGNEVPPGSLPEEVRDDIDAKLSGGEYVVPADVVRFHGVKFFEDLRTEAKVGLSGMDADGRIGGEPVLNNLMGQGDMAVSEEEIAMLEEALAGEGMPAAAVAKGGLMDKMALAAKNDPLVNSRMNAKGMAVGFAAGGLQSSLYDDPTRIDSIIDKVVAAAQSDPSFLSEMAKRGVALNTTQANMKPEDMAAANVKPKAFKDGGGSSGSSFNPLGFGLGFSSFGTTTPAGQSNTISRAYYNPATGATMMINHDANTNAPLDSVPAGFIMGSPPVAATAPAGTAIVSPQNGSNRDGNTPSSTGYVPEEKADPDAWKKKYNYNDKDALYAATLEELTDPPNIVESFFNGLPIGKGANASLLGGAQANIDFLTAGGFSKAKMDTLKEAWAKRSTKLLGSTTGGPVTSVILNLSKNSLASKILEEYGDGTASSSTAEPKARPDANPVVVPVARPKSRPAAATIVGTGSSGSGNNTNQDYDGSKNVNKAGTVVTTSGDKKIVTPKTGNTGGAGAGGGGGGYDYVTPKRKPSYGGGGARAEGGLMQKKKK